MNYRNENQAQGYAPTFTWQQLQSAVLAEREACSSLLEDWSKINWNIWDCAEAIRARSEK